MKKILSVLLAALVLFSGISVWAEETYTGQAQGFGGLVTVTLTMANGVITQCSIEAANETAGIGTRAIEEMPAKIIEANGTVDIVTGATITSTAILNALDTALAQTEDNVDISVKMTPGTYQGAAWGFSLLKPVTVDVVVDEISIVCWICSLKNPA